MAETVSEEVTISVAPQQVYDAVADIKRMAQWSPECIGVWVWRREGGRPTRFVGWNRRGPFLWFTTCTVRVAQGGNEPCDEATCIVSQSGKPHSSQMPLGAKSSPQ